MHKEIPLSQGEVAIVDSEDYEMLSRYKWHLASRRKINYASGRIRGARGKLFLMHRLIMNTPDGMDTDHINGDGLDNRKSNLRICSHSENMRNQRSDTSHKGVHYVPSRKIYIARIIVNKVTKEVGRFVSLVAAACAYDYAAKEHYKEFSRLNFPGGQPLTPVEIENQRFKRGKSSVYLGVYWWEKRGKWQVKIGVNYKSITVGYFSTELEAAKAYNEAAIKYHGKKVKLNILANDKENGETNGKSQ